MRVEELLELIGLERVGVEEALAVVTVLALERIELFAILDALCERLELEGLPEPHERLDDGLRLL